MKPILTHSIAGSRLAALALAASLLGGAAATAEAGLFRAKPAPVSEFIENPELLTSNSPRAPFHKYWRNPSPRAWAEVADFEKITFAPVETCYLRPRSDLIRPRTTEERRPVQEMADYMRSRFERRFAKSGEYLVVRGNGPKTLVVELALVELNPSNFAGNIVKTGGSVFVPGVGFLGSQFTRGGIAIEGKIRNGETGELLVEFADRQQDRTTLFSFRDFTPYAHDRAAIDDWAKQLDRLSRTPSTYRVRGSLGVALNPF